MLCNEYKCVARTDIEILPNVVNFRDVASSILYFRKYTTYKKCLGSNFQVSNYTLTTWVLWVNNNVKCQISMRLYYNLWRSVGASYFRATLVVKIHVGIIFLKCQYLTDSLLYSEVTMNFRPWVRYLHADGVSQGSTAVPEISIVSGISIHLKFAAQNHSST